MCMRWATLPKSGREPLDSPATAIDKWPAEYPIPEYQLPARGPEVAYPWEQSQLYFTKRSLMLVCKDWEALAMEYMYESLVVELFRVGEPETLFTLLQTTKLGERFRRWVKRVDAHWNTRSALAKLLMDDLPNAQVQRFWLPCNPTGHEVYFHTEFPSTFQPHTIEISPRHFYVACTPTHQVAARPRHLSLHLRGPHTNLRLNSHIHFQNLQYLALIVPKPLNYVEETFLAITEFWTCPVLTHLCINVWDTTLVCPSLIPNLVSCLGRTLRHLEILAPTTASSLHSILQACPNITTLVVSAPLSMVLPIGYQLQHTELQTVGLGVYGPNTWTLLSSLSDRELFPKLSLVRIVTPQSHWRKPSLRVRYADDDPLRLSAIQLLKHEIRFEDCTGADLAPIFVPRG